MVVSAFSVVTVSNLEIELESKLKVSGILTAGDRTEGVRRVGVLR